MSAPKRDSLDQAIDRVAARLVSVDHDEVMVERIVARLPERSGLGGWLRVLVPQAALATALIVAVLVWTTRDREPVAGDPVATAPIAFPTAAATEVPVVRGLMPEVNALTAGPRVAVRRVTETVAAPSADHERSLAPVAAVIPLEVVSLASPSLPDEAFVVLAPIVLTELPLSGESISPR